MTSRPARRIWVVGTTGSGKTTLARRLEIPHVELDALHWAPDWTTAYFQAFRGRAADGVDGGVVDGNYSAVRDIV